MPRISVAGFSQPQPVMVRLADDPVDATRLAIRLHALAAALDDLPGQAKRFARWKARRDAERSRDREAEGGGTPAGEARRFRRLSPLKPGRPPGWRRKPVDAVHMVLNEVHGLAVWALKSPDTS